MKEDTSNEKDYLCNIHEIKIKTFIVVLMEEYIKGEITFENCYIVNSDTKNNAIIHPGLEDYFYFRDSFLKNDNNKPNNNITVYSYKTQDETEKYLYSMYALREEVELPEDEMDKLVAELEKVFEADSKTKPKVKGR